MSYREELAFRRLHPILLKTHKGQFVAIYQEQLVDHDEDQVALYLRVDKKYPDEFVLIAPVNEQAEEVYHFRSPRVQKLPDDDGYKVQSLRESLKQEIDLLNESQLVIVAEFIDFIKRSTQEKVLAVPSAQQPTQNQRTEDLREWVARQPKSGNYTEERHELLAGQTLEDIVRQIEERRARKADIVSEDGWEDFVQSNYGICRDEPLERGCQGTLEIREALE